MSNLSYYLKRGREIDHTPATALDAGSIVQIASLSAYVPHDIAALALGSVVVDGVIRGPFVGGYANVGDNVWWDANGTPYGSGATTGAFTCNAAAGDWWVGILAAPTATTDTECDIALNVVNPALPAWIGRTHFTYATDTNFVEATHSGGVVHLTNDGGHDTKLALITAVVGMEIIVVNDGVDAVDGPKVVLSGTETVIGANQTAGAGTTLTNTAGTAKRGDYIHLVAELAGTAGVWRCVAKRGTWAAA
jgi:predicted RecA/RadA family phage recombinase